MTKFNTYDYYRSRGEISIDWIIQLIDNNHQVIWSSDPAEAVGAIHYWAPRFDPLQFLSSNVSQRTATMRAPIDRADMVPDPGGPFDPTTNNKVRIWELMVVDGVRYPDSQTLVATMLPDEVTVIDTSGGAAELEIQLVDLIRPIRSNFDATFKWAAGAGIDATVFAILGQVMGAAPPAAYAISPIAYALPKGSVDAGSARRDEVVAQMLAGAGQELVADPQGLVINRDVPDSRKLGGGFWLYGEDGIPMQVTRKTWSPRAVKAWRIEGGSVHDTTNPPTWTVYDLDPNSMGFYHGPAENIIQTTRLPWVRTQAQAKVAGYAFLRRNGTGPGIVTFTCPPNPYMAEGDDMFINHPGVNLFGWYKVLGFRLPLHSEALMEVTARAEWDPSQGSVVPPP